MDLRALPRRGQFPVAVDVAVPIEPAPEAGFQVSFAETGQVGFAEPIRQRRDGAAIAEKSLTVFDEQRGGWIGKSTPKNSPPACQATGAPQSWPTNDSPLFSERSNQRHHVADVIEDAVRVDIGRCAGSAETPHIRCCDMETRGR
jgi:hypothetical protein